MLTEDLDVSKILTRDRRGAEMTRDGCVDEVPEYL